MEEHVQAPDLQSDQIQHVESNFYSYLLFFQIHISGVCKLQLTQFYQMLCSIKQSSETKTDLNLT